MDCYLETGDSGINGVLLNGSLQTSSTLAETTRMLLSVAYQLVLFLGETDLTAGAYSVQVQLFYELFQAAQEQQKPMFQRVWMSSNAMPVDSLPSLLTRYRPHPKRCKKQPLNLTIFATHSTSISPSPHPKNSPVSAQSLARTSSPLYANSKPRPSVPSWTTNSSQRIS